eukprot:scaffold6265_cov120-Skeletonema_marinoi.AAC.9
MVPSKETADSRSSTSMFLCKSSSGIAFFPHGILITAINTHTLFTLRFELFQRVVNWVNPAAAAHGKVTTGVPSPFGLLLFSNCILPIAFYWHRITPTELVVG